MVLQAEEESKKEERRAKKQQNAASKEKERNEVLKLNLLLFHQSHTLATTQGKQGF